MANERSFHISGLKWSDDGDVLTAIFETDSSAGKATVEIPVDFDYAHTLADIEDSAYSALAVFLDDLAESD